MFKRNNVNKKYCQIIKNIAKTACIILPLGVGAYLYSKQNNATSLKKHKELLEEDDEALILGILIEEDGLIGE